MEITVKRIAKRPAYTIGKMYLDGMYFCDTLEDTVRDLTKEAKVYGKTAIPAGKYPVVISFSPRFKKDLPLLMNVPYFSGVRIHSGNTAEDTEGCILVGENKAVGKVLNSRATFTRLMEKLQKADKIYITIE